MLILDYTFLIPILFLILVNVIVCQLNTSFIWIIPSGVKEFILKSYLRFASNHDDYTNSDYYQSPHSSNQGSQ